MSLGHSALETNALPLDQLAGAFHTLVHLSTRVKQALFVFLTTPKQSALPFWLCSLSFIIIFFLSRDYYNRETLTSTWLHSEIEVQCFFSEVP